MLYRVEARAGGQALVYVLLEHQSTFDPAMALRLLGYMTRIWEAWRKDNRGASLPPILPVVLHHGRRPWAGRPELGALLGGSEELLAAVAPHQPHFRFVLDDLSALSLEALSRRAQPPLARLVLLALRIGRSMQRLAQAAPYLREALRARARDERARDIRGAVFLYFFRTMPPEVNVEEVRTMLLDVAGPQGREDVMNAADMLIEEGRQQGREEGRQQGREQGERDTLRAVLIEAISTRRFSLSTAGSQRIAACADAAILRRWVRNALTATSEGGVFSG
jgi:Putative transposase, YhgA-like